MKRALILVIGMVFLAALAGCKSSEAPGTGEPMGQSPAAPAKPAPAATPQPTGELIHGDVSPPVTAPAGETTPEPSPADTKPEPEETPIEGPGNTPPPGADDAPGPEVPPKPQGQ